LDPTPRSRTDNDPCPETRGLRHRTATP
jgi:hypothetical protein